MCLGVGQGVEVSEGVSQGRWCWLQELVHLSVVARTSAPRRTVRHVCLASRLHRSMMRLDNHTRTRHVFGLVIHDVSASIISLSLFLSGHLWLCASSVCVHVLVCDEHLRFCESSTCRQRMEVLRDA